MSHWCLADKKIIDRLQIESMFVIVGLFQGTRGRQESKRERHNE
jgi:hypothetical protein